MCKSFLCKYGGVPHKLSEHRVGIEIYSVKSLKYDKFQHMLSQLVCPYVLIQYHVRVS